MLYVKYGFSDSLGTGDLMFRTSRSLRLRTGSPLARFACVACTGIAINAFAQSQLPFVDQAIQRGISYVPDQEIFDAPFGEGAAFADLDNDGDPDLILLGRADGLIGIFENNGQGMFVDHSANSGLDLLNNASGIVAGDYDGDGQLDIYISRWNKYNKMYRNLGSFHFLDVTAETGVGSLGDSSGCGWGDIDGDGWLDLYVTNRSVPNLLFHNVRGAFTDVAEILGCQAANQPSYQATFLDFDRDGDADLYIANDRGALHCNIFHNLLYRNRNSAFVDSTVQTNTAACVDAMCIAVGDLDNNRLMDLYITNNLLGNSLLMQQPNGTFLQQAAAAGVSSFTTGWGSVFFDYDNDGYLDLYVCNEFANNLLYHGSPTWPMVNVANQLHVNDSAASFACAIADIDNDGDVDLLVVNRDTNVRLFINQNNSANHWAKFNVVGRGHNRWGVGTNVDVRTGTTWRQREVIAGDNYKSQNELKQHVGIGAATTLDEIVITWPGPVSRTITNLSPNQTWTLYPLERLGDANGDGAWELVDFLALEHCFGPDSPGSLHPGCEIMDFDGDADVDLADFSQFLKRFQGNVSDCNANGANDFLDILLHASADVNFDGVPDECECIADISPPAGNHFVNIDDLLVVLLSWGRTVSAEGDINHNSVVDVDDLLIVINSWGPCD